MGLVLSCAADWALRCCPCAFVADHDCCASRTLRCQLPQMMLRQRARDWARPACRCTCATSAAQNACTSASGRGWWARSASPESCATAVQTEMLLQGSLEGEALPSKLTLAFSRPLVCGGVRAHQRVHDQHAGGGLPAGGAQGVGRAVVRSALQTGGAAAGGVQAVGPTAWCRWCLGLGGGGLQVRSVQRTGGAAAGGMRGQAGALDVGCGWCGAMHTVMNSATWHGMPALLENGLATTCAMVLHTLLLTSPLTKLECNYI
jgi:hypothetical protein